MSKIIPIGKLTFNIILDKDGVEYVKIADLCAPFGLMVEMQTKRLKSTAWGRPVKITGRRSDEKTTSFSCLALRRVPMFFATMSPGHVNEEARPALEDMQTEVADAVADYYLKGGAIRPDALPKQLLDLREAIDEILRPVPLTDPIWPVRLVKRYQAWHGKAWKAGDPQPLSMKSANWFFYQMIFPQPVLDIIRARGIEEGVRYHQVIADVPRDYLARQLEFAARLADDCGSEREWRARMRRAYSKTAAALIGQGVLDL